MILLQTNLQTIILIKLIMSLIYLITSLITHKIALPVTLANVLRLFISSLDFVILLTLLFHYVWEFCALGYTYPLIGFTLFILTCGVNWAMLIRNDKQIQPIFIIGVFSFIVLILLHWLSISTNFMYKGTVPALLLLNTIYLLGWLMFDFKKQIITNFAEKIGEQLSWVDSLVGNMLHKDVALRNICSFNLGLLNLTYLHTSGGAVSIITLALIGLGLLLNILIGLRLIKASASVTLENSFMVDIIKYGYNNVSTIYNQLKSKQLPKATRCAWVITLTMGVTFISPCYAMTSTAGQMVIDAGLQGEIVIDASLQGELPQEAEEGIAYPVSEGASKSRGLQEARYAVEHNQQEFLRKVKSAPAGLAYSGLLAGLSAAGAYVAEQAGLFETAGEAVTADTAMTSREAAMTSREAAITAREATLAQREADVAEREAAVNIREQAANKASWFGWLKGCWKNSSNG